MCLRSTWTSTRPLAPEALSTVSEGLGILLALLAVTVPLILAWVLVVKDPGRRRRSHHPQRTTMHNNSKR